MKSRLMLMLLIIFIGISALALITMPRAYGVDSQSRSSSSLPYDDLQRFAEVIAHIKANYVEEIEDQDLLEAAILGMVSSLDPHSTYLNREDNEELQVSMDGRFGGLGIEVTLDENGFIEVVSPIDNTPASQAGIQAGDLIIRLDDTPVKGLSLRDAVERMRGLKGEAIKLHIFRDGETLELEVIRDTIVIQSVRNQMLEPDYGYLRISHFQKSTPSDAAQAVTQLKQESDSQQLNGLVLDLRNNPGGLLDAAVGVADVFLNVDELTDNKTIVYTEGRMNNMQILEESHTRDLTNGTPIVVLVNQGSASASEIVAGALQDHHRAIIMGTPTFGKGSVQSVIQLDQQSALKLTTALYYTPNGNSIQAEGIQPDITIEYLNVTRPENLGLNPVTEANLEGHINTASSDVTADEIVEEPDDLAVTDFPLYQALLLLKGLNASS